MRVAITGGTGFVGRTLAQRLADDDHDVVIVARGIDQSGAAIRSNPRATWKSASVTDLASLTDAFRGCDAVVHCAGINREKGTQTYAAIHVQGTRNVVAAAVKNNVQKIVALSFYRARPNCGSAYHESKWQEEEIVRASGIPFTILKPGVVYGRGDHMLDHLSFALTLFWVFPLVGSGKKILRPLAVEDLVTVMVAALTTKDLDGKSTAVAGPDAVTERDAIAKVGRVIGHRRPLIPAPVVLQQVIAWISELLVRRPLATRAQVRILAEGLRDPALAPDLLPTHLTPRTHFTDQAIRNGLPLSRMPKERNHANHLL